MDLQISAKQNDEVDYLYRISEKYSNMTRGQKKIARYLVEHQDDMCTSSITQLAQKLNVTPSAITRFCQALNYKGFSELKFYVGKHLLTTHNSDNTITEDDSLPVLIQKMMLMDQQAIADTMLLLDPLKLKKIAELCTKATHIHFYGEGATGVSASMASAILMQIGISSLNYSDSVLMRMAASTLEKGDIAFGITYSGQAYDVIEALKIAKKNGAATVAITGNPGSIINGITHYQLVYSRNIQDQLTQLPVARICEIAIFGLLQVTITRLSTQSPKRLQEIRKSIEQVRKQHSHIST